MNIKYKKILEKTHDLGDLAMDYEVAVKPLFEEDYLKEFYDFYEIKDRKPELVTSEQGLDESLKDLNGEYRWEAIAEKTRSLFGLPVRIKVFKIEDLEGLKEELGGPRGLSSFFFVFDLMFCEYEDFTLCFISGSNN